MTPALRQALIAADGMLRRNDASGARRALETVAKGNVAITESADLQFLLAQACFQSGDPESARAHVERVFVLRPNLVEAHRLHGLIMADLGLLGGAANSLERAMALQPADARTCTNLAAVYRRRGMYPEALATYLRATSINQSNPQGWRGLAETLQALGREDESLAAWKRWSEQVPYKAEGSAGLGRALAQARRWADAEVELSKAAGLADSGYAAATMLGFVRRERGDTAGALEAYQGASRRAPAALTPRFATALTLPQIYVGRADVKDWRERYAGGLASLSANLPQLVATPEALWDLDWSNFYLGYQGEDDLALQREYADLVGALARAASPNWMAPPEPLPRAGRRLRIGFASSHFRSCTVGAYFESWLTDLDPRQFEVHAFYFGSEVDAVTQSLRTRVDHFVHLQRSVRHIAERVRAAQLDVLVYPQLGMDGLDATLSALRLAPVQCVAWGHPVTTGCEAIDYYFSCAGMEPPDSRRHYRETLLLLPGVGTRYKKPTVRAATRAEFGLPDRVSIYACPQSLFKIHPDNDSLFCDVLAEDPRGHLLFCAESDQPATTLFRKRLRAALDVRGIDLDQRVLWQPMRRPEEFRSMLSVCDVMLDTLHWSGGNTSLDSLAAGVPIVTHPGRFLRGRQSAAMLRDLGLPELIATETSAVATIAVGVANEPSRIRAQIITESGRIFNRDEPIQALESHLLRITGWAHQGM
ncbi:MAG: tetratricopeptide repeat protein [Betaproteobacteria bacterium]